MSRFASILFAAATFSCENAPSPAPDASTEADTDAREFGQPYPGEFDARTDSRDPSDAATDSVQPPDALDVVDLDSETTAPDADAPEDTEPGESGVRLEDGVLLVDGRPFEIRGVAWNPVGRGGSHPADLDFAGFVERDAELMQALGLNAVRTYEPITDRAALDTLYEHGIYVLNTVYPWGGHPPEQVRAAVEATRDHPGILLWLIGNEWNYNGLYAGLPFDETVARVAEVASEIRTADPSHPIATVYGGLPSPEVLEALREIDVWGINAYSGLSFGDLFDVWSERSARPMFMAEFGADAWNSIEGREDPSSQAEASLALFREIEDQSAAAGRGPCLGGTIFEWADEWWKDGSGSPDEHDTGGLAPGGGPHPDATFNEEWWGLVDIDRNPREAYDTLRIHWSR